LFLFVFWSPYWQKYCSFIPAGFFCPHTDKHLAILYKHTFDTQSINIFGLVYIFKIDDRYINIDRWSIIGDNCLLNVFTDYN
jgi:hypothetical protein